MRMCPTLPVRHCVLAQDIGLAAFHLQEIISNYPLLPLTLVALIGTVEWFAINKGWSQENYKVRVCVCISQYVSIVLAIEL
jgi:hypothetical protein